MKKKLYLITSDFPYGQGEESFILPELPYLCDKFEVTIISTSLKKQQTTMLNDNIKVIHYERKATLIQKLWDSVCYFGCKDSYLELWDMLRTGKIRNGLVESVLFFEEARRFKRYLKRENIIDTNEPVIIYSYWFTFYCLTLAQMFEKFPNVKLITRAHRFDLYNEGYRGNRQPFKRQMDRNFDYIVFIAEHGRQYYLEHYGNKATLDKYRLFRLGVKPTGEAVTGVPGQRESLLLVSCANVLPRKRIDLIVDALAEIRDVKISWVHFGDGVEFDKLKEQCVQKLQPLENIEYELMGHVRSDTVMKFYENHYVDAFITTTASEGCPVSVQEAMSYGIPIIGTAVAEIPFMIRGNGFLLHENPELEEIVHAIRSIASMNSDEIMDMRTRSFHLWEKEFDVDVNATNFVNFLDSIGTNPNS
ncbi:MAG: glycosyltransferase [Lachnospiraceae bacterium]|nr:glycosyltransferase [Lachnospiraceae bacterium]